MIYLIFAGLIISSGALGLMGQGWGWYVICGFLVICLLGAGRQTQETPSEDTVNSPAAIQKRKEEFERQKLAWQQAQSRLAEHEKQERERAANPIKWLANLPVFTKQASDSEKEWMRKG